jgi:4'-phosphopantetheinyl transferase
MSGADPGAGAPPTVGECTIWWASLTAACDELLDALSPVEVERLGRFHHAADRDRSLLSAALLRGAAAALTGQAAAHVVVERRCPDCSREHGRPALPGTGLFASASHSGGWVCVALTDAGPVGIDVEQLRPHVLYLADTVAEPREAARIRDDRGLLVVWTRKESVVKATGDGLRTPLPEVVVTAPDLPPRLLGHPRIPADLARMFALTPDPDHVATLAVLTHSPTQVVERPAGEVLTR